MKALALVVLLSYSAFAQKTTTVTQDLFSSPEHVVQSNQVHLIALHYNIPISFEVASYRNRQKMGRG